MKRIFMIFALFFSWMLYSQEKMSYNSKRGKIEFSVSNEEYYSRYSTQNIQSLNQQTANFQKIASNAFVLKGRVTGKFASNRATLGGNGAIQSEKVEPILISNDGVKHIVDGQINIKIKPNVNINKLVKEWNFTIQQNEYDPTIYLLTSSAYTTEAIFGIVDELQKSKDVEFAEPNFIRLIFPYTADPYFSNQWAYKNDRGADIKIQKAWEISTGLGVKVAVLDEGVDLNHPDLKANLLTGYDVTGNNSKGAPNYDTNDSHGTACAGIIAAVANNNVGISGIAYKAKIVPVRIAYSIRLNNTEKR